MSLFPTPLILLLAPFCAGICLWHKGLCLESATFAITLLITFHLSKKGLNCQNIVKDTTVFALFCLLGFSYTFASWQLCLNEQKELLQLAENDQEVILSGHVLKTPTPLRLSHADEDTENIQTQGAKLWLGSLTLHTPSSDCHLTGQMVLSTSTISWQDITCGDWVRFKAKPKRIRNYKTPGVFDEETWWASQGIFVKATINSPVAFAIINHTRWSQDLFPHEYFIEQIRFAVMKKLTATIDKERIGVAAGLLLGEKSWLDDNTREFFAKTGTGHLIAVSGLHMAIISMLAGGFIYQILLRFESIILRFDILKTATIFSMLSAMFYATLTGLSPSAHRSMLMILAAGIAFLADRPKHILNALALAAWVLLLMEPLYLFNISFQLSFIAVLVVVLSSNIQSKIIKPTFQDNWLKKIVKWIAIASLTTIITTIGTAPLVLWHFQRLSLVSLPANLVLIPLTTFATLPCLVFGMIILPVWEHSALFLWNLANKLIEISLSYLSWLSSYPNSNVWLSRPDFFVALIFSSLFILLLILYANNNPLKRLRLMIILFLILTGSSAFYGKKLTRPSDTLWFHVLDVGQGLCQVVELPDGKLMLIDTGAMSEYGFDAGKNIVAPFLRHLGYDTIDIMMLTHPEQDHIGGAATLLNQFTVKEIWRTDFQDDYTAWSGLNETAKTKCERQTFFQGNEIFNISGVNFRFSPLAECQYVTSRNSRSLSMILTYQNKTFFVTGDMEKDREKCLISKAEDVDVMVAAHHGSATSNSEMLLKAVQPEYIIISAGYKNRFHHPSKEVLKRFEAINARILRTDIDGTVSFKIKHNGELEAFPYQ